MLIFVMRGRRVDAIACKVDLAPRPHPHRTTVYFSITITLEKFLEDTQAPVLGHGLS